ncbi:SMP-30/gluconolactonase/LRE family protein [Mesobacterium pallidum]|uniref:SMP-30/gluconolactonase/LRE family protein n=1 Tax=Mesobacterium pallidum TaxID=2872037 RepID=UPI001EE2E2CC|nr:SMP-30/gluconolactonase/LRE family protein [Mesobacterium pallidum]
MPDGLDGLTIRRLDTGFDALGESPVWDAESGALWWIDGVAGRVRRLAGGEVLGFDLGGHIGAIALATGGIVATLGAALLHLDPATGAVREIARADVDLAGGRLNDGKLDRQGRFVSAGMGAGAAPTGALHSFGPQGHRLLATPGLAVGNGVCFSPDGGTLYVSDTRARMCWACDYDTAAGTIGPLRDHIDGGPLGSGIDGATVDAAGNMWAALIHTSEIACFAPDGTLLRRIPAPVDLPSSLAFGGPDMATLYLTSIRDSGTGRAVSQHPDGGGLFAIDGLKTTGIPEFRFKGDDQ